MREASRDATTSPAAPWGGSLGHQPPPPSAPCPRSVEVHLATLWQDLRTTCPTSPSFLHLHQLPFPLQKSPRREQLAFRALHGLHRFCQASQGPPEAWLQQRLCPKAGQGPARPRVLSTNSSRSPLATCLGGLVGATASPGEAISLQSLAPRPLGRRHTPLQALPLLKSLHCPDSLLTCPADRLGAPSPLTHGHITRPHGFL